MKTKTVLTYGLSLLFLLGLITVFYQSFQGVETPVTPS
jgi:hypothetical protein